MYGREQLHCIFIDYLFEEWSDDKELLTDAFIRRDVDRLLHPSVNHTSVILLSIYYLEKLLYQNIYIENKRLIYVISILIAIKYTEEHSIKLAHYAERFDFQPSTLIRAERFVLGRLQYRLDPGYEMLKRNLRNVELILYAEDAEAEVEEIVGTNGGQGCKPPDHSLKRTTSSNDWSKFSLVNALVH